MPHLYLSGSLGSRIYRQKLYEMTEFRLLSLHGQYYPLAQRFVTTIGKYKNESDVTLLFDSGAYTAWSKKEPDIEVSKLLAIYKRAKKRCEGSFADVRYINLDKIPGEPGKPPTQKEVADALRISDENYKILFDELGDKVLPVFHQSEPPSRLDEVVGLNPNYVCISPRLGTPEAHRREWCQRVHGLLEHLPVKTHGLATTSESMLMDILWTSVDSSSWVVGPGYGLVAVPRGADGEFGWIAVSEHSSARKVWGSHADTADPETAGRIQGVCDEIGIHRNELRTTLGARELFTAFVMLKASKVPQKPMQIEDTLFAL